MFGFYRFKNDVGVSVNDDQGQTVVITLTERTTNVLKLMRGQCLPSVFI